MTTLVSQLQQEVRKAYKNEFPLTVTHCPDCQSVGPTSCEGVYELSPMRIQSFLDQTVEKIVERVEKKVLSLKKEIPSFEEIYGKLGKNAKTGTEAMFYRDDYNFSVKPFKAYNQAIDDVVSRLSPPLNKESHDA
jgi:hypothetical protein